MWYSQHIAVFHDETHIKISIVRHQHSIFAEIQKLRQDNIDCRLTNHHIILDTRQFFNLKGNRHLRIDKSGKTFRNLPRRHFDRTNFNDSVIDRRKARRLNIEYNKRSLEALSFIIRHDFPQIVYQISFHAIDNLKKALFIRLFFSRLFSLILLCLP